MRQVAALKFLKSISQIYRLVEHNCFIFTHLTEKTMTPKMTQNVHVTCLSGAFFGFCCFYFWEEIFIQHTFPIRKRANSKENSHLWHRMRKFPLNESSVRCTWCSQIDRQHVKLLGYRTRQKVKRVCERKLKMVQISFFNYHKLCPEQFGKVNIATNDHRVGTQRKCHSSSE